MIQKIKTITLHLIHRMKIGAVKHDYSLQLKQLLLQQQHIRDNQSVVLPNQVNRTEKTYIIILYDLNITSNF